MDDTPSDWRATRPPIVAIGASAGGLDPLEAFFEAAPVDAGWAFFVIQHLSPDYRSMMDELLGRKSSLRILHAEHGMAIEPNTIYLNPPNVLVTIEGDAIALEPFDRGELPQMPIDAFFYSLAAQEAKRCFAVVLSGSGADGARGAAAVHKAGGRVIVQTPGDAKFDSMPRAVIASGAVDRVLDPGEMPAIIRDMLARPAAAGAAARDLPEDPHAAILTMLERDHGLDFSHYKKATVLRRIERRAALRGEADIAGYRARLEREPDALEELYHDLLIGVTEFYRDPEAFAALERLAIRPVVERGDADREIRVWVPGCASGEEAYSLAIALTEAMEAAERPRPLRVIATDVHRRSIERAAAGVYPEKAVAKLPPALRERWFREHQGGVAVDPAIRRNVIFSVHDALADPPFMRMDLISCRNLMIYLDDAAQSRLLSLFEFGLRKDGFLFLGSSESLGDYAQDFVSLDSHWRIYRWTGERNAADPQAFVARFGGAATRSRDRPVRPPLDSVDMERPARQARAALLRGYDALLKRYAPSSILVAEDGEVLTWFGDASDYVDTLSDLAERTVEEMVHKDLHYAINVGIERIRRNKETRYERRLTAAMPDGPRSLAVAVEALKPAAEPGHYLVTLERLDAAGETAAERASGSGGDGSRAVEDEALMARRIQELERDLKLTEESLQYVTERLETSGEELQASNEELQASNEELQASNEELQSSNEELHAVNEELVTVSAEHQRKIEQLEALHRDTEFVFDALDIGVVMLAADLTIRRFTGVAGRLLALMPHDAGRPIAHVGARLAFAALDELAAAARESGAPADAAGEHEGEPLLLRAVPCRGGEAPGDAPADGVALLMARPDRLRNDPPQTDPPQTDPPRTDPPRTGAGDGGA